MLSCKEIILTNSVLEHNSNREDGQDDVSPKDIIGCTEEYEQWHKEASKANLECKVTLFLSCLAISQTSSSHFLGEGTSVIGFSTASGTTFFDGRQILILILPFFPSISQFKGASETTALGLQRWSINTDVAVLLVLKFSCRSVEYYGWMEGIYIYIYWEVKDGGVSR